MAKRTSGKSSKRPKPPSFIPFWLFTACEQKQDTLTITFRTAADARRFKSELAKKQKALRAEYDKLYQAHMIGLYKNHYHQLRSRL
jgi:hypothetical protein